jgi:Zn-dependent protease
MIFLVHFGWGKPVQINPSYYKHPRRDELMVALAGPATNLVLALSAVLILVLYSLAVGYNLSVLFGQSDIFVSFRLLFASINISLAVFNMLPLPPLDGFRLIKMFFWKQAKLIEQYSLYISLAFLFIIMGPGSHIFSFII